MSKVISRDEFIEDNRRRFPDLDIQEYKLRDHYSVEHKLFFDCKGDNLEECAKESLEYSFHQKYVTFIVIRKEGKYHFQSIGYRNPAVESLEHFMGRYETTIKPSLVMTLVGSDKEFVELLGFSYE